MQAMRSAICGNNSNLAEAMVISAAFSVAAGVLLHGVIPIALASGALAASAAYINDKAATYLNNKQVGQKLPLGWAIGRQVIVCVFTAGIGALVFGIPHVRSTAIVASCIYSLAAVVNLFNHGNANTASYYLWV